MPGPEEFDPTENILNPSVPYEGKQSIFDSFGSLLPYIRTIRLVPCACCDGMDMFYIQFVGNTLPNLDPWPTGWRDLKVFARTVDIKQINLPPVPFGPFRLT